MTDDEKPTSPFGWPFGRWVATDVHYKKMIWGGAFVTVLSGAMLVLLAFVELPEMEVSWGGPLLVGLFAVLALVGVVSFVIGRRRVIAAPTWEEAYGREQREQARVLIVPLSTGIAVGWLFVGVGLLVGGRLLAGACR